MVELKNVNVHYSSGVDALQNINLRINDGEFVFIVGGSGAGKSTLVKLMTREIVPTEGRVVVNGYNLSKTKGNKIAKFRRSIGMVFQDFRLIQELNVYENVAFVLRIADQSTRFIKQRVPNVLNLVGLGNKARSKPRELSGGEQQRVAIARALAKCPPYHPSRRTYRKHRPAAFLRDSRASAQDKPPERHDHHHGYARARSR